MIFVQHNTDFLAKVQSAFDSGSNDFERKLTTINAEYNSLKTEMNRRYEGYRSSLDKINRTKRKRKYPSIETSGEMKLKGDHPYGCVKTGPIHQSLHPKVKVFINLYKSSINQNKRSINNYKQCIQEIEKEFYITGSNFSPNTDYRRGLNKKKDTFLMRLQNQAKTEGDEEPNLTIASKISRTIKDKLSTTQLEAIKLEELKKQILIKKEKIGKRLKVLKTVIQYMQSNGISLDEYLKNSPIPPRPFYKPYSEEFISAAKFNKIDIIEEALSLNTAYLFEYDYLGQTAFHWAAKLGYVKLLQLLLRKGKCCNLYDKKMRTPLYLAALNNQIECCLLLMKKNGNLEICDIDGKRPFDVATDPKLKMQMIEIMDKTSERDKRRMIKMADANS